MAAHRYWRLVGFVVAGAGALELSEVQLYAGGARVGNTVVPTCAFAPASGALADLSDGLSTGVVSWPAVAHRAPGFALVWDLTGAGSDVDGFRLGAGSSALTYPLDVTAQYSDDGADWTTLVTTLGVTYPGAHAIQEAGSSYVVDGRLIGAWSVCSLRKRVSAYAGSAVRVRRSSDNAEADIGFDEGGVLNTVALAAHVGAGDGFVARFYDQCGLGHDFIQPATAAQPRIVSAGAYDGKLVFSRSGTQLYSVANSGTPTAFSIYFAGSVRTPSVDQIVLEHTQNFNDYAAALLYYTSTNNLQAAQHAASGGNFAAVNFSFRPASDVVCAVMDREGSATDKITLYRNAAAQSGTVISINPAAVSGGYVAAPWYFGARGSTRAIAADMDATDLLIFETAHAPSAVFDVSSRLAGGAAFQPSDGLSTARLRGSPLVPERMLGSTQPDGAARSHARPIPFFDAYHGGLGIIYGTVKEKNTPANTPLRRKVWLMDERSGLVIRETWSDAATGAYEFRGIKQGMPYTVLAYDHEHNYRAFAGDNLLPDPMP